MMIHISGIPKDLADAFAEALEAFAEWKLGDCEPIVSFQSHPTRISDVFNVAAAFRDVVPEPVHFMVRDLAANFRAGPEALGHDCSGPKENTYLAVGACMLRLYLARVARYVR
jgi:hypothetical protein